jgi:hypothetical protein
MAAQPCSGAGWKGGRPSGELGVRQGGQAGGARVLTSACDREATGLEMKRSLAQKKMDPHCVFLEPDEVVVVGFPKPGFGL